MKHRVNPEIRIAEFDRFAGSYEELIRDPLRDAFAGNSDFFQTRKRDVIRNYFSRRGREMRELHYLDMGCGKGELMSLLASDFARVAGCDPSRAMLEAARNLEVRVQQDPTRIPFADKEFDFITAVCVYHHVPFQTRLDLCGEVRRVLRPGGVFALIEHNPLNPATRMIVRRSPMDAGANLLCANDARSMLERAGFTIDDQTYFLYFPEKVFKAAAGIENLLRRVRLGGQYAMFGKI